MITPNNKLLDNGVSTAKDRSRRIEDSLAFSSRLEPSHDVTERPTSSSFGIETDLRARIEILRRLAEPRSSLPSRFARLQLLRWWPAQRTILRVLNYVSRPVRTQAEVTADSLDLICVELKRIVRDANR